MNGPNDVRARQLARLANERFDLLIIGGGITGAGIARDAAARGLSVALIEKLDYGAGTSSKSSKLVHGGLRYLEQGELGLVFESVNERKRLMRLARHLVRPLPFLVTNYAGDRRWLTTLAVGLWVYDALCFFGNYRNHRTYGPKRTLQLEPGLKTQGLNGGILYYDALTDDARLTLECILDAEALGAVAVNHCRAGRILKDAQGRIVGVEAHDEESASRLEIRATVIINATGPWSDEVRALAAQPRILKPTKGVHIVVDAKRLPIAHALMLNSPRDKRVVFSIPWGLGRTVVGTTDTFFDGSPDHVDPTRDDVTYLLETANAYFPSAELRFDDVISTWSGLRPLLAPEDSDEGASAVSREHVIHQTPGFITIAGGKLTTFRRMAAEVVDRALEQLGKQVKSPTATRPLPGAQGLVEDDAALEALIASLPPEPVPGLNRYAVGEYGARAPQVLARAARAERLDPELPSVMAQVDEAIEVEHARTVDDVLNRRIPLILRARDQGLGIAPTVADRLQRALGWQAERRDRELERYRAQVARSRAFQG